MAFGYYRPVTIDHSLNGGSDQTDKPVAFSRTLSYLAQVASGGVCRSDGRDIGWYADILAATKRDYEQVEYNAATGFVHYRYREPTLHHSTDDVDYLFYSDPSASDLSNPTGVWSAATRALNMADNAASTVIKDSAGNGNFANAANTSGKTTTSPIGSALLFDGSSDFASGAIDLTPFDKLTLEVIRYVDSYSGVSVGWEVHNNFNNQEGTFGNFLDNSSGADAAYVHGTGGYNGGGYPSPSAAAWHHTLIQYNYNSTTVQIPLVAIDGIPQTVTQDNFNNHMGNFVSDTLSLMSRGGSSLFGAGRLAAFRIWGGVLKSADWAISSSNNELSPATYQTIGSEVSLGTAYVSPRIVTALQAVMRAANY